jgi:hypothetical protein
LRIRAIWRATASPTDLSASDFMVHEGLFSIRLLS